MDWVLHVMVETRGEAALARGDEGVDNNTKADDARDEIANNDASPLNDKELRERAARLYMVAHFLDSSPSFQTSQLRLTSQPTVSMPALC
jgi:hypothetical protein